MSSTQKMLHQGRKYYIIGEIIIKGKNLHQGIVTRGQGGKCHKGKKCHIVKVMYDQGV